MTVEEVGRGRGVQSVDRTLAILEVLATHPGTLRVTEVARATDLPAGTAHRLLTALSRRGWVRQEPDRRYGLGPSALLLGDAASRELSTLAAPALRAAVEATGETANLAAFDGERMVYLAQSPSPHTLRIFAEVGRRVPVHSTAVGKVALAALAPEDAERVLATTTLEARTPHTLVSVAAMQQEVSRVRRQGYAVDDEEQELGVRCVAVPVDLHGGRIALSVSGPVERMTLDVARRVVDDLTRVARDLAERARGS